MLERFSDAGRSAVFAAKAEAARFGHHYIGTEHLLLGLVGGTDTTAAVLGEAGLNLASVRQAIRARVPGSGQLDEDDAKALKAIGVDLELVRSTVESTFGPDALNPVHEHRGRIPLTRRAKKVLGLALRESVRLDGRAIGSEHVLLGLVREGEGLACVVMEDLGVSPDGLRDQVLTRMGRDA
jgi:ATP-dependent Clp protease ATP-binding subunit ClpA